MGEMTQDEVEELVKDARYRNAHIEYGGGGWINVHFTSRGEAWELGASLTSGKVVLTRVGSSLDPMETVYESEEF